jgi:hypothetical protein
MPAEFIQLRVPTGRRKLGRTDNARPHRARINAATGI